MRRVAIGRVINYRTKDDDTDNWKAKFIESWESSWLFFLKELDKDASFIEMYGKKEKFPQWFIDVEIHVFGVLNREVSDVTQTVISDVFFEEMLQIE